MWPKHAQQTTETLNNSARKCYYRQLYMWSNEQHSIEATLMLAKTNILALQYFGLVWWNNIKWKCGMQRLVQHSLQSEFSEVMNLFVI